MKKQRTILEQKDHMARMTAAGTQKRAKLKELPTCDFPGNAVPGRLKMCRWNCGKTTRNISEIGDTCWKKKRAV